MKKVIILLTLLSIIVILTGCIKDTPDVEGNHKPIVGIIGGIVYTPQPGIDKRALEKTSFTVTLDGSVSSVTINTDGEHFTIQGAYSAVLTAEGKTAQVTYAEDGWRVSLVSLKIIEEKK